jgi:hypothetical protein
MPKKKNKSLKRRRMRIKRKIRKMKHKRKREEYINFEKNKRRKKDEQSNFEKISIPVINKEFFESNIKEQNIEDVFIKMKI